MRPKTFLQFFAVYGRRKIINLLDALYSSLKPVPVMEPSVLKWIDTSLLPDIWFNGIEDPQNFPSIGDKVEAPSYIATKSKLQRFKL